MIDKEDRVSENDFLVSHSNTEACQVPWIIPSKAQWHRELESQEIGHNKKHWNSDTLKITVETTTSFLTHNIS